MPGSKRQNSMFGPSSGYIQKNNPFPVTSCGRRRNTGSPLHNDNEPKKTTKGKGRNFRTVKEGAGMTQKGVNEYKAKNPGSNLQTAVTEKNPSKKDKKRRDAFCARSKGWTGERGKAARRRWRC
jgi:hypothetical protein